MIVWLLGALALGVQPEIVLVGAPGLDDRAYLPLVQAMRARGAEVSVVSFPCSGDSASLGQAIVRSAGGRDVVLVAHGLGATLALGVAAQLDVRRWVLLGPILGPVDNAAIQSLRRSPIAGPVDLSVPMPLNDGIVQDLLLGPHWTEFTGCLAPALARELQVWSVDGWPELSLGQIGDPVWISVGALDELAPVEVLLPASRRFPNRTVIRAGIGRMDRVDLDHLGLLLEPFSVRLAATAAVQGW